MAPIHVTDPETDTLVRQLAGIWDVGLTETIKIAVQNELAREGIPAEPEKSLTERTDHKAALHARLEAKIRSTTLEYTRLLAKERGTRGVGSRVYQMLARHKAVETLRRLVAHPTEGLSFLVGIGRRDLSAEEIALDPTYETIIDEDIRARARANLAAVKG